MEAIVPNILQIMTELFEDFSSIEYLYKLLNMSKSQICNIVSFNFRTFYCNHISEPIVRYINGKYV